MKMKKIRIVKQKNRQLKKKVKNLEAWIREHQPQTVGAIVSLAGYKGYEILNQNGEKVDSKPGIFEKKADCIEARDSLIRIWITEDSKEESVYPNVMLKTKDAAPGLIITDPKGDIMTSRLCQLYKEKGYTISLVDPDAENVE